MTQGAFAPNIPLNEFHGANRAASGTHGYTLVCEVAYDSGEAVGCFAMYDFFVGTSQLSSPIGVGMLFVRGVAGGKLQPGPMTWTQIFLE